MFISSIPTKTEVQIDQANLTGESYSVPKNSLKDPFLLSGTIVMDGELRMLVTCVGIHSQWGKILVGLEAEDEQTPLQDDLDNLASSKLYKQYIYILFLIGVPVRNRLFCI